MNDIVVEKKSLEVLAAFSKILVLIYIAFITFYCQYKYYFVPEAKCILTLSLM